MCLYPQLITNPKYKENQKNGGIIPAVSDIRVLKVPIGCGNCIECRKKKAREWQIRLLEDIREFKNGKFITLTFSNEELGKLSKECNKSKGYDLDNDICTLAVRRFLERWRKEYKKSLRHWLITELGHGETEHVHMHGIVWTDEPLEKVETHWKYGWVWKGKKKQNGTIENYVNERTVNYIIKYVHKTDLEHRHYKPIILTSPGIGKGYTNRIDSKKNKFNGEKTNETYKTRTGHKVSLPIYWRNKIYSDEEKEQLWLQKLDKNTRWVCGEKIDISITEKEYYKILKYYQDRNTELGYGNNKKDWRQEEYEQQRRQMKIEQRTKKGNGLRP